MSGKFVPPSSPLARTTPVTVYKSERVLSPISSPISRGNAIGSYGADSPSLPSGIKSPSPLPSDRVKSPYTGLADVTQQSAKTLEEMLSAYRASKGESNPSGTTSPALAPSASLASPRGSTEGIAIRKEDPLSTASVQSIFPAVSSSGGSNGDLPSIAKEPSAPLRTAPVPVIKPAAKEVPVPTPPITSSSPAAPAIDQPHSLRGGMQKLRMTSVDDNEEEEGVVVITDQNMHQLERMPSKVDVPRVARPPIAPVSSLIGGDIEFNKAESRQSTPPLPQPTEESVDPLAQTIATSLPSPAAVKEVPVSQPIVVAEVLQEPLRGKQQPPAAEDPTDLTTLLMGTEPQQPQQPVLQHKAQPPSQQQVQPQQRLPAPLAQPVQEVAKGASDEDASQSGASTPPALENSPPKRQGGRVAKPPNAKPIQSEVPVKEDSKAEADATPAPVPAAPAAVPPPQKTPAKPERPVSSAPKEQPEIKTPASKKAAAVPSSTPVPKPAPSLVANAAKAQSSNSATPSKPAPAPAAAPPKPLPAMSTP
eukprot:gene40607-49509_t